MATLTNTTSLTNTIKTYYDRVMLEVLDPKLIFYQFGAKKPLPKGEGMTIIWNLPKRLALGNVLGEGGPTLSTNALSTFKVSAIIRQFGGVTTISDMVDMTSITDVMKIASERLGAQAGETIERVIAIETMVAHKNDLPGTSAHHLIKTSSNTAGSTVYAAGNLVDYWGSVSGVSTISIFSGPMASAYGGSTAAVSDFRKAIYTLKALNVPAYEGNDYVAIIPTEVAEDIVGDTTWINFHQYAAPGQASLYSGEIGKIYGCRFVESNCTPIVRGSCADIATTSAYIFGSLIMGKGFYGVTDLDGGIKTFITQGAEKGDPLNQYTTYGWKANFIAQVLNASAAVCLWTGHGTYTTAAAESADGYLRVNYPAAY